MEQASLDLGLPESREAGHTNQPSRSARAAGYVNVYPLVPTRGFDNPLTYGVEEADLTQLVVGSLVEIPVGSAMRVGVVAELDVVPAPGISLKNIGAIVESASVPPHLIELAEWIADTYATARTRALALVVPPAYSAHARARSASAPTLVQAVRKQTTQPSGDPPKISSRLQSVLDQLDSEWTPVARVCEALGTTRASLDRLVELGYAERSEIAREHANQASPQSATLSGLPVSDPPQLTQEQLDAVEACLTIDESGFATLLAGVTGSGKTEVYLHAIQRVLDQGEGAIVLVPEISLTPQTSRRFVDRFGQIVEVLHSGMTRAERQRAWTRIAAGESRVVVGPRSACFAPISQLGIIILDEEHDTSYKQESDPRYDARRVAYKLAQLAGAAVVYGSATPRPESWHGIRRHVRLHNRAGGGELPPVEIVDLRQDPDHYPIGLDARAALDATVRRGRKAIVLHNRRGYSTALHCRGCGSSFRCDACDVSLVVHGRNTRGQRMRCHHCGYSAQVPDACPSCSSVDLARLGVGTERLERDLRELLGDIPIIRMDADAVSADRPVAAILDEFAQPGPAVLVGTQMIAKGHDFADVDLVVVIDADTALAIPDFRAEERAFMLVAQVAGRAGRSADSAQWARVIVQTWQPDSSHLARALTHDVEGYLDDELARRRPLGYPPFSRIVRVLVSVPSPANPDAARSQRSMEALERWSGAVREGLQRLEIGPVSRPSELLRIGSRDRVQVLLKTTGDAAAAARALRAFLARTQSERSRADVRIVVDVDPQTVI